MKIRLLLSYQGTDFLGWQRQKKGRTVQGELEKALKNLFQQQISVFASGRTDRGAHALGQVAHFEISENKVRGAFVKNSAPAGQAQVSEHKLGSALVQALNHLTPPDISLMGAWRAPDDFHARFSVEKKTYLFLISNQKTPLAVGRRFVWWNPDPLSMKKLNALSQILPGERDFKGFQNTGSKVSDTIRVVYEAYWREIKPSLFCFTITGSGFLRQMVRNIVGAQAEILRRDFSLPESSQKFQDILERKQRSFAFSPSPPEGLYLKEVFYPPSIEKLCIRL